MTDIRFSTDLYSTAAIDSAVEVYSPFADLEVEEADGAVLVRVSSKGDHDESTIADELSNYVLGMTIEERHESKDAD